MGKPAQALERYTVMPTPERIERNRAAVALIEGWFHDESGHDEAIFPELKRAMEDTQRTLSARPPFDAD